MKIVIFSKTKSKIKNFSGIKCNSFSILHMLCKFRWNRFINKKSCPQGSVPLIDRINKSAISVFSNNLTQNVRCSWSYCSFYAYQCFSLSHKYKPNVRFLYFHNKINVLYPAHDHSTRFASNNNISLPAVHKTVSQIKFLFKVVGLWDGIPQQLKLIQSNIDFKRQLKSSLHLIHSQLLDTFE